MHRFWLIRETISEGRAWLEGAFTQATDITDTERAKTLNVLAIFAWTQGEIETAKRYYGDSLAIYQHLNMLSEAAKVLNNMAVVAKYEGDFAQASLFYHRCLTIYRDLNDDRRICILLNNLGGLLCDAGDHAAAMPLLEESLRLHRAFLDEAGEATALYNLGDLALACHQLENAETRFTESMGIFRKLGEGKSIVRTLIGLAAVYSASKRFPDAVRALAAAQTATESAGAVLAPNTQVRFNATLSTVKPELSPEQFELLWHEGQTTNMADIIAGIL